MINLSAVLTNLLEPLLRDPAAGTRVILLCLLASSSAHSVADSGAVQAEEDQASTSLAQHQATLQEVDARLAGLRERIADRLAYREALLAELRQYEQDVGDLARANRQLVAMVSAQEEAVAAASAQMASAGDELERARAAVAELVRAAHALGRGGILRVLLNQDEMLGAGRAFGYYRVLADARSKRVIEVARLHERLRRLHQERRDEMQRLARLASRQEDTRQRLAQAQGAREAVLRELETTIAVAQDQAVALAKDASALRELIGELERIAEIEDEVGLSPVEIDDRRGQLEWPLSPASVLTKFGAGREQDALHADGVLLAAESGAEVQAVHRGRVVYADWLRGFGMLLVLDHGDGYMTLYGHNQALLKEVGEWVAAGDLIALAGESGGAERRGLYFAIRRDGRALDPEAWCSRREQRRPG